MLHRTLVPISSNDIGGVETLTQSTTCRMNTRETPAAKVADAPWSELRDICASAIQITFLTQEEMVLEQTVLCFLL